MSQGVMSFGSTPECCHVCKHFDWTDSCNGSDVAWCNLGLIFPTKKQACAMRNKDRMKVKPTPPQENDR